MEKFFIYSNPFYWGYWLILVCLLPFAKGFGKLRTWYLDFYFLRFGIKKLEIEKLEKLIKKLYEKERLSGKEYRIFKFRAIKELRKRKFKNEL